MDVRALSVRQPWAWAIICGGKTVENRTWSTTHRGVVAIHAARTLDERGYAFMARLGLTPPREPVTGAVIGLAHLVDCRRDGPPPWAVPGAWHWIFEDPAELPSPLPLKGQTRLFRVPAQAADELATFARELGAAGL